MIVRQSMRLSLVTSKRDAVDLTVYTVFLALGALQCVLSVHAGDILNDTRYFDLARSIVEKGAYQFNFKPETLLPPGFPLLLALIILALGPNPYLLQLLIVACSTAGLFVSYELLKRVENRWLAAASCLLLGSSPVLFVFSTTTIFSDLPYFALSTLALLLIFRAEATENARRSTPIALLTGLLLVLIPLIRTSGIVLIAAMIAWVSVSSVTNRAVALRSIRTYGLPVLLAIGVQCYWIHWTHEHQTLDWPVQGYPRSYVEQLKVVSGNNPDLGMASLSDVPNRIVKNVTQRSAGLGDLLAGRRWFKPVWCSPVVFSIAVFIAVGLFSSIWRGGGHLHDWYFLFHEVTYLVWPWNLEERFLLPVAPLACLYLWRGSRLSFSYLMRKPTSVAFGTLPLGVMFLWGSLLWARDSTSLQSKIFPAIWILMIAASAAAIVLYCDRNNRQPLISQLLPETVTNCIAIAAACIVLTLFGVGLAGQIRIGLQNLTYNQTNNPNSADIEAACWIRDHEPGWAVVMARNDDLVHHYTGHRVVWFPPTANSETLAKGILRHKINVVVIVDRISNYWLPRERECFQHLEHAHPGSFQMVHHGPGNWVYEVSPMSELHRDASQNSESP